MPPVLLLFWACNGQKPALSPEAERGRIAYQVHCVQCHNADPSLPGPVGPAIKGASRALIEARILRAAYPEGYTPRRTTTLMPAMPQVADDIDDLTAWLSQ